MSEKVAELYNDIWLKFGFETYHDSNFRIFQRTWFLERFNLDFAEFVKVIQGKRVLEIGTGAGAFLRNLKFAKTAHGLDISKVGTNIARTMHKGRSNIEIITCELMQFEGEYDIVIADQVLHHLPDTFKALEKAVSLLKPSGEIFFYVYKKKAPIREFSDIFLRIFTTRIPIEWCLNFSKFTCWIGKTLTKFNLRLQRWVNWNIIKCFWNDSFTYDNNLRVNYDWYSPKIAHRHTLKQVKSWIKKLNLKPISIIEGNSGISVRATK